VRLLHTGDWHLGKRLYGQDRREEGRAALAQVVETAARERVDATLVTGDLLDRRVVDPVALRDCLEALEGLAATGPVLVVTGNHDDPALWEALAPFLAPRGITVRARVGGAAEAVVGVETAAGPLHAALLPWPTPRGMAATVGTALEEARSTYAEVVGGLLARYGERLAGLRRAQGGTTVLVGHLMVDGALAGGGERELTLGMTYAVSPAALPTDLDYVALGHVHRPQPVPRVAVPARYAGSPIALDFSEDTHAKSVAVVEADGQTTTVREVPLTAGRPLVRLRGGLDDLAALASGHGEAWFLCEVELDRPVLDLVRQVRERVPDTLRVEPRYAQAAPAPGDAGAGERPGAAPTLAERYEEWYALQGRALSPETAAAFARAVAEAERAAAETA
jgi:exonuclease SbcD